MSAKRLFSATLALVTSLQGLARAELSEGARAVLAVEKTARETEAPSSLPAADVSPFEGRELERLEVQIEGNRWRRAVPILSVAPGDLLTSEAARTALHELAATGAYAQISAEARLEREGLALILHALPRRIVSTVQLIGGELDDSALLESVGISEGMEITAPQLPVLGEQVRAYYAEHGFDRAQVLVEASDTDDAVLVALRITVDAGPPRTLGERRIAGPRHAAEALDEIEREYVVVPGNRVDEQRIDDADRLAVLGLRRRGYFEASVTHRLESTGTSTVLLVQVDPGPKLVPRFEGQRAFDADQLTEALDLEKNPVNGPQELVDRVRRHYVHRGYLDVEVELSERRSTDGAHALAKLLVREGERVRVGRRTFPCLSGGRGTPLSLRPDRLESEIDSFLEESLPGVDPLWSGNPATTSAWLQPGSAGGGRAPALRLDPVSLYAPEPYERALKHLRDLAHNEGYLHARVGPIELLRARCSSRTPSGECVPAPWREPPRDSCPLDAAGLPASPAPADPAGRCDPHGQGEPGCSPEVRLRIPVHLGPRTLLHDLSIEGHHALDLLTLVKSARLQTGNPISPVALEAARSRVLEAYRERGFAYARVVATLEPSPDQTRARARLNITEGDPVTVSDVLVRGLRKTDETLVLSRLSLKRGLPYRQSQVKQSEERIGSLGAFSSVSIALEDPELPAPNKRVIVTVSEQLPQYLDPRVGFSTGEGLRFAFEYGHRNVGGKAIALTLRVQLSYLFDWTILDPQVKSNLAPLAVSSRLERRNTISWRFPEIGLGPSVGLNVDGVDLRDNQRDYGLTRQALLPALVYRPFRALRTELGLSGELNDVQVFTGQNVEAAIRNNPALARTLRVPDGRTVAVAQRLGAQWDGRDNPFSPTRGFLLASNLERVNAYPVDSSATFTSDLLRVTGRAATYFRLSKRGASLALSLAAGGVRHLDPTSKTYPDRLLFLGGVDSLRGFLTDALVPEDVARNLLSDGRTLEKRLQNIGTRGGDLSVNPRSELRLPLTSTVSVGLFLDTGNVWRNSRYFSATTLRYAGGAGLRLGTPIGPLALDYGINLVRRPWEDFGAFHFSIGLF